MSPTQQKRLAFADELTKQLAALTVLAEPCRAAALALSSADGDYAVGTIDEALAVEPDSLASLFGAVTLLLWGLRFAMINLPHPEQSRLSSQLARQEPDVVSSLTDWPDSKPQRIKPGDFDQLRLRACERALALVDPAQLSPSIRRALALLDNWLEDKPGKHILESNGFNEAIAALVLSVSLDERPALEELLPGMIAETKRRLGELAGRDYNETSALRLPDPHLYAFVSGSSTDHPERGARGFSVGHTLVFIAPQMEQRLLEDEASGRLNRIIVHELVHLLPDVLEGPQDPTSSGEDPAWQVLLEGAVEALALRLSTETANGFSCPDIDDSGYVAERVLVSLLASACAGPEEELAFLSAAACGRPLDELEMLLGHGRLREEQIIPVFEELERRRSAILADVVVNRPGEHERVHTAMTQLGEESASELLRAVATPTLSELEDPSAAVAARDLATPALGH